MDYYSNQISRLIEEFSRLPGIGNKSAQRLAFHVINMPVEQVEGLANAIVDARKNVRYCKECCTLTDKDICPIWRHRVIWQRMRRPESTTESIMYFTGQFLQCLESVPGISV